MLCGFQTRGHCRGKGALSHQRGHYYNSRIEEHTHAFTKRNLHFDSWAGVLREEEEGGRKGEGNAVEPCGVFIFDECFNGSWNYGLAVVSCSGCCWWQLGPKLLRCLRPEAWGEDKQAYLVCGVGAFVSVQSGYVASLKSSKLGVGGREGFHEKNKTKNNNQTVICCDSPALPPFFPPFLPFRLLGLRGIP